MNMFEYLKLLLSSNESFLTINKNNVSNLAKTMIFYKIIKQTNKTIKIN